MNWKPLWDAERQLLPKWGEQYLFASYQLAGDCFEYFVDALIWDSEIAPLWELGDHGISPDDTQWFCEITKPGAQ